MRVVDIIAKKRDGLALTPEEIRWFISRYTAGDIPDYQAAAWLMAVWFRGMTREETAELTLAMAHSGDIMDLSDSLDYAVDKHSSGGVGDKTSLIVLPLVVACGVPVAKMSGRGLGFTGGTLDKLESIAGYNVNLTEEQFRQQVREHHIVLCGQTGELAPADGKLYALRDVTATVSSIPLIAGSIMSKKIAAGANGIVLDVKTGSGAFMSTLEDARILAQTMVDIGVDAGKDMVALISDMNQPLGCAVGNALEVKEAIEALNGGGPEDLREHCLVVAAYMLRLAGRGQKWVDMDETRALLESKLDNGEALAVFRRLVEVQGGDVSMVDNPDKLPSASIIETLTAEKSGYAAEVRADKVAQAALILGAGREKKGDPVDLAVGVLVHPNVGDEIQSGQTLFTIHGNDTERVAEARAVLQQAVTIQPEPAEPLPLFYDVIQGN